MKTRTPKRTPINDTNAATRQQNPIAPTRRSLEYFEIVSHEIEYINEVTMSFVDIVLLWSLCGIEGQTSTVWMACIASLISLVQLAVYNCMGRTEDGDMVGEVPAHFLEFSFEIISSLIAFWFCMDNKVRVFLSILWLCAR